MGENMGSTSVQCPKCASCQYGKQERTPKAGTTVGKEREGITKADKLEPGDLIFSDQYEILIGGKVFSRMGAPFPQIITVVVHFSVMQHLAEFLYITRCPSMLMKPFSQSSSSKRMLCPELYSLKHIILIMAFTQRQSFKKN